MKQTITIIGYTDKTSKLGKPYCSFETNIGRMSCWDGELGNALKKLTGNNAVVEYTEKGEFKNIVGIHDFETAQLVGKPVETATVEVQKIPPVPPKTDSRNATMYVAYAKDLIIAGKTTEEAITAIRALKAAFS